MTIQEAAINSTGCLKSWITHSKGSQSIKTILRDIANNNWWVLKGWWNWLLNGAYSSKEGAPVNHSTNCCLAVLHGLPTVIQGWGCGLWCGACSRSSENHHLLSWSEQVHLAGYEPTAECVWRERERERDRKYARTLIFGMKAPLPLLTALFMQIAPYS